MWDEKWVNHVSTTFHMGCYPCIGLLATTKLRVTASCKSQTHARTASPCPRHLLAMSHVLDDNVAPENCGGRRKFWETEGIALLKEIVANDAHVCRRGQVTETFEKVARALNEGNAL
jgi:hypothetical protein